MGDRDKPSECYEGHRGFFKTNCEFGQLPTPPATTSHPSWPSLFNCSSSFLLLVVPTTLYCHRVMILYRGVIVKSYGKGSLYDICVILLIIKRPYQVRSIHKLPTIERIIPTPINKISKLYNSPGFGPSML